MPNDDDCSSSNNNSDNDAVIASDSLFESIQMGGPMGNAVVSIFDRKTRKLICQYNQKAIDLTSTTASLPNSNTIPEQIITQSQYNDDNDGFILSESLWFQSIKMKNPLFENSSLYTQK